MRKTAENEMLQKVKKEISPCDRCGACLPVCPLFGTKDLEISSARGKNALSRALADGGILPTRDVLEAVNFCLLCRACTEICPNKIKTDEAMINLRQYLIDETGGNMRVHKAMAGILMSRPLVKLAAGALALLRRFNLGGLIPYGMAPEEYTRTRFLAAFAGPAALGGMAPAAAATVTARSKVAYFAGCGMRMMFPEASAQTKEIIKTTTSLIPKDNVCCGLPHLAHGMRSRFLTLARKNLLLYEDADLIISDCASCSSMLKHTASYFAADPLFRDQAAAFGRKVMDLSEYLVTVGYRPRRKIPATLTYHDPCHLARGQDITRPPRDLLTAAGTFVEMKEAAACCGGAGLFHLDYPEIAASILAKKRHNIEAAGAAFVVTSCPGCLIRLSKAAKDSGGKFQAMHLSQVI